MKNSLLKMSLLGLAVSTMIASGCSPNDGPDIDGPDADRWITVSGSLMKDEAGDGNGGTRVFSMTPENAKDPNFSVNVFDNGGTIKSERTARLQASQDGKELYNIQYVGEDGGIFNKYLVRGGKNIVSDGPEVSTAEYVSESPRWLKAAEGVGIAVRATVLPVTTTGTAPNFVFKEQVTDIDVISLDLKNPKITKTSDFQFKLSAEEVAAGYYVGRIDVPIVNKAGNKVYIGASVSKYNTKAFTLETNGLPKFNADNASDKSWAKTIVLDYPSLTNPKVLSSTQTRGNTNGYRSTMQYIGTDGHVYQATSGEKAGTGGSKILRISSATNDYDNAYVFSLDQALGVKDTYIESWKYAGDGIGFVVYSFSSNRNIGHIARIDLNQKTATKYNLPNEDKLKFQQIQNIAQHGDDVFIAVAPVGADGNIYIFNKRSGAMSVGAKLINKAGNQYIGVY